MEYEDCFYIYNIKQKYYLMNLSFVKGLFNDVYLVQENSIRDLFVLEGQEGIKIEKRCFLKGSYQMFRFRIFR